MLFLVYGLHKVEEKDHHLEDNKMRNKNHTQWIFLLFLICLFSFHAVYGSDWNFLTFNNNDDWEDWDWDDEWSDEERNTGDVHYNRVEGLYLGYRIKEDYFREHYPNRPFVFGKAGYSFGNKEFQYQIGIEKGFMDEFRLAFGGEYHRNIETPDRWIVPEDENWAAAFFFKEDYYDYYLTEGSSIYITQKITPVITWKAAYHVDDMESEKKTTNWSLFGGRNKFRKNPLMSEGEVKSIKGSIAFDTRNSKKRTTRGWFVSSEYEHAAEDFDGAYVFDQFILDARRYQPLGYGDGLDMRVRIGSGNGHLPWQRTFQLGGISTLRGYKFKELTGGPLVPGANRMFLAQVEYRMGTQDLPDELDMGILEHFNLILFSDLGWVDSVDPDWDLFEGFDTMDWKNLKNDIGIALANRTGNVRFELARRTDTSEKPFIFYFRVNRTF